MNKPLTISTVIAIIILSGVGFLILNKSSESPNFSTDSKPNVSEQKPTATSSSSSTGAYKEFSPDNLANSGGQAVLFFHAPWCPQCRSIDNDIKNSGVPDGFTILKVDYDSNQELRKKYGVTLQTTLVKVDNQGNAVGEKFVAYDEPTISSIKQNYLDQ